MCIKFVAVWVLVVSTVYGTHDPDHVQGVRVPRKTSRAPIESNPTCPAFKFGAQCASDCRTMMTCGGPAGKPIIARTCVNINPFTPYCVKGKCSASPDMEDPNCVSAFTCTWSGYFPDPTDCTKYHVCEKVGKESVLYQCPHNYVYDSALNLCTSRSQIGCSTVDCTGVVDHMVVYGGNPAYYAFCKSGLQAEIFMFRCVDVVSEVFDVNWGRCVYNCPSEGNHVDRTNCYGYVTCSYDNKHWVSTKQTCPRGHYFKNNACVPHRGNKCEPEITLEEESEYVSEDHSIVPDVIESLKEDDDSYEYD